MSTPIRDKNNRPPIRVKEFREERYWSIEYLAEKVGISKSMMHYIETGERAPGIYIALAIAKALGKTVEVLWGGE